MSSEHIAHLTINLCFEGAQLELGTPRAFGAQLELGTYLILEHIALNFSFKYIVPSSFSSSFTFYGFGVYWNPDLLDNIFDCLLTAIAKVQSVDRKAFFLFLGNVNAHHEEWFGYSTTISTV